MVNFFRFLCVTSLFLEMISHYLFHYFGTVPPYCLHYRRFFFYGLGRYIRCIYIRLSNVYKRIEAMHNVPLHYLPRYYQRLQILRSWCTRNKQPCTKIVKNFWITLVICYNFLMRLMKFWYLLIFVYHFFTNINRGNKNLDCGTLLKKSSNSKLMQLMIISLLKIANFTNEIKSSFQIN